jgi:SM-20-related protein
MPDLSENLMADGIAIQDGFLSPPRVRRLIECAEKHQRRGEFSAARVGADRRSPVAAEIRGDRTCWIIPPLLAEERALLCDLERLRVDINREGFLGVFDLELHYARYPPGAGYARHVDQLRGRDHRKVSLIVYLNESWTGEDGGELRIFDDIGGHRDIEPAAGRLVCFLTAEREHAVLPSRRDRLSIAGWFRQRGS